MRCTEGYLTEAVGRSKGQKGLSRKGQELTETKSDEDKSENDSDNSRQLYSKKSMYRKPMAREDGVAH